MNFPDLLLKTYTNGNYRVLNISAGDEAVIDELGYETLQALLRKKEGDLLSPVQQELLSDMESLLGLRSVPGSFEKPIQRSGDLDELSLLITNSCNLRCRHCYFYDGPSLPAKTELEFADITKCIEQASLLGAYKVTLSGGEPLLHPDFVGIVDRLTEFHYFTTVITNGTLISEELLSELSNANLSFIVSLDGYRNAHDAIRGAGSFDRALRGVRSLQAAGFEFHVNTVVTRQNCSTMPDFSEFLRVEGASSQNLQVLRPTGRGAVLFEEMGITDPRILAELHTGELEEEALKLSQHVRFCRAYEHALAIEADGNVSGCEYLDEQPIGNICEESLGTIYARGRAKNPISAIEWSQSACGDCELWGRLCAGGCRARAIRTGGAVGACDYWIPFLARHDKFKECVVPPHMMPII